MRNDDTMSIFRGVVNAAIGSEREINDGGSESGPFILEPAMAEGVAENLATWWDEKFDDTPVTFEMASDYLDEVYPEI